MVETCPHIDGHSVSARRLETISEIVDLGVVVRHSQNPTMRPVNLGGNRRPRTTFILRLEIRN